MKYIIHNNTICAWNIQDGKIEPLSLEQVCNKLNANEINKHLLQVAFCQARSELTR